MLKSLANLHGRRLLILFSLALSVALLVWALTKYQFSPTNLGLHTVAKLILLSMLLALVAPAAGLYAACGNS